MLTLSLILAGLALTISTAALTIAVYFDLRDRDVRIRAQSQAGSAPLHAERPTLRLWEQPTAAAAPFAAASSASPQPSLGPDIVVGRWPATHEVPAADERRRRDAA